MLATFGILGGATAGVSNAAPAGPVYLALGDSVAASFQPNGDLHSGYAEQVFQLEQARQPDLRLAKLACPGATTRTMDVPVRRCPYPEDTQLAQAVAVLESRDVAFVTLQVGSNDFIGCFRFRAIAFDEACVDARLPKISARLTSIVEALRAAGGPDVSIVGATYYDPLLVAWTFPGVDPEVVAAIATEWTAFNDMLEETYAALGVPVADVEGAFSATDFDTIVRLRGVGDVPISVARTCQWTYACSRSFDPHPNTVGYAAMTRAFEAMLVDPSP
jgi:lysophospholipase L1-like esterase